MLEADYGLTDAAFQSGQRNGRFAGDERLYVKFFKKPVQDMAATAEEGRPIFGEVDYVEIRAPGNKSSVVCRPARDMDKQRFSEHWKRYQDRVEQQDVDGTPLEEWAMITRSQVEELKFFNIFTVEQLAHVSDGNAQKFMGINILRQKAQEFIEQANVDEIAKRDELIAQMQARLEALEAGDDDEAEEEYEEEEEEELEA